MRAPFDDLVTRHGPAILRVCRAVVGWSDAEDVWSETFLAALRAYPDLPDGANVEAWLVTIAKRKGIDALRAGARRALPVETVPDRGIRDPEPDAELQTALAELTPRQREVIAYHVLGGLPYAEVAEIVGGTAAAARRAAADGLARLRRIYAAADSDLWEAHRG
ncbi:RNA polymerase sigma factor, sigma-70 family [Sanguibacter gelidistatuariae]|uniref:RNA polymerase sigma factor, sigma-70 family n=1 Tax=Sanguibacter gelidistatuariae TaxID=1814289 RepID=A0A1G6VPE5_9MICO|nr:RNA polymerase sigma factor [Sanguibacter gelidistatuariae]SDD55411.1 RNA polymerase sigma factor, sigma-70 family [Sanguibacter gelidistatuariae]